MPTRNIYFAGMCALLGALNTGAAHAQGLNGIFTAGTYVRGDLGWSMARDAEIVDKDWALDGFINDASGTGPGVVNDIGSAYVLGIGVGARISPLFRAEVAYTYRGGYELDDVDQELNAYSGDISSNSVMANLYWDIPFNMPGLTGVAPFVGGGIGWASNKLDEFQTSPDFLLPGGTTSGFAWQLMVGVGVPLLPLTVVDIFYRYFDGGDLQSEEGEVFLVGGGSGGLYTGARGELVAHEIMVSLRFLFGP